ncbi:hypothetical protein [Paractinoplanes atraurantiacus]|uniref:4-amino-4-deoxy-L-arabinose transferase n=1 Tax=Paractinoplanes atraurantiacus TaxID=1036182 RepID=A0A285HCT8_9ACTN|nr:hypothetical protein [Actinoplanes atraurantiacus]SNY33487.1 hypothetical protein SAMN05421748_104142 [Actinoplanes atraurantiacus]
MWARHRLEWVTAVVAAVLGAVYLLLPPMGSDLAAQVARAEFFADHGYTPIDLRWYAGVDQLGYSLVSQPVMALLGVRLTGALSLVGASVLFAVLLRDTKAPRPWLGALAGTVCIAGNLASGRVTYGLGVFFGLAALVLVTRRRAWLAAIPALLAGATSPVAGLFLGLAGVALAVSGRLQPPTSSAGEEQERTTAYGPVARGLLIAVPAAIPLAALSLFFGDGGWMNISRTDTFRAVVASLAVALFVPRRPVRVAALLSAAGVLTSALIHTPVGLNATRLAVMFTLPLLAAYATWPWHPARRPTAPPALAEPAAPWAASARAMPLWAVALLLAVACWWQPPVVTGDIRDMGNPTAERSYFTPLLDRLAQEKLTGRVEIPSTRDYWEAAHMGDVPLARGWLRQADIARNPLFFTDIPGTSGTGVPLTADTYRAWLDELAVQFVAVPDAELTWSGRPEAALIAGGLPYLTQVWSGDHWRLYAVSDARPLVGAPATLVTQTAGAITFDAPVVGDVVLRVRFSRWLTASNGAVVDRDGDWVRVHIPTPGRYTLTS